MEGICRCPLLNILQETLLPCPVSPWWDEEADGHQRVVLPQPGWQLPSQSSHSCSATPAPEDQGWQPLLLPLSSKPAWRAFSSPNRVRSHWIFVHRLAKAGK